MPDLDAVLKKSLADASPHTKKVFGQNPLNGQEILDMANTKGLMTLGSTVRMNGRPHLSPVDLVGVDGVLFLGVDLVAAHYANLKRNPGIALMIMEGWKRQALVEGTVGFLDTKSSTALKVQEAEKRKTGWTTEAVAEVKPDKIFSRKGN